MPTVTVLMTVYNAEAYLKASVQSVLRQTYKDFELLVIDDKSTDNSAMILRSFQDERIKIHENAINIGQTKSLNRGLELAQGEYIARVDADDMVFPSWLEKQISFLKDNPEYAVVSTPAVIVDGVNRIRKILRSLSSMEDIMMKALIASPVNHVGCVMRKDAIMKVRGYNEALRVAADYELWSTFLRRGYKISSTRDVLTAIRVHEQSVSMKENQKGTHGEVADIIGKNFFELAKFPIRNEEASLIAKLDYSPGSLDSQDLRRIHSLLEAAFKNIGTQFHLPVSVIEKKIKKTVRTIYIKKIFYDLGRDDSSDVQALLKDYFEHNGSLNLFLILFLCSGCGMFFMKKLPSMYRNLSMAMAWFKGGSRYIRELGLAG